MAAEPLMLIGITLPETLAAFDEAGRITALLDSGALARVHLRKDDPGAASALLGAIPRRLHRRLSLHRIMPPPGCAAWLHGADLAARSCSCHSMAEAGAEMHRRDYVMLSPVFDSLSKRGYRAVSFDYGAMRRMAGGQTHRARLIALGGVTPARFDTLRAMGFDGAAMLGYLWTEDINPIIDNILCCNS